MEEEFLFHFCGSTFWDINLTWNTESPRFTPCFEKTVLAWLPCAFLCLFSCVDIYYIVTSESRNIPWNWRNKGKLTILFLLLSLCLIELLYNFKQGDMVFPVDIYTPIIRIFGLVLCGTLVIFHRKYGLRSTGLLFIFWMLTVLLGFSQFYTDIERILSRNEMKLTMITYVASYCLYFFMFLLHCISDLPPNDLQNTSVKNLNPVEGASYPSRLILFWFDHMIYKGFKRPLLPSDLWPIRYQDAAGQIFHRFYKHWDSTYKKNNKTISEKSSQFHKEVNGIKFVQASVERRRKPSSIILPLFKAFGGVFMFATLMQITEIFLLFINPKLLKNMINFVSKDEPIWRGYLYAVLLFIVSFIITLNHGQLTLDILLVGLRIRTALVSAIYRKALKLSNAARKKSTLGEIVNLMSVDAQSIMSALTYINYLWLSPLQIGLSLYFLWQELGPCVLTSLAVMFIMIFINYFLVKKTKDLHIKQMKNKDERIKIMNEILTGMKVLKLYAWESSFEGRVLKIRDKETKVLKKAAYLKAASALVWSGAPFLVSLLTFTTYILIDENNILDSSKVFVSLSLFSIMQTPLLIFPTVLSSAIQAFVSVKRINNFLNSEELDVSVVTHEITDDEHLVMENCSFSWGPEEKLTLQNLNLKIKMGSLVAVVGGVGFGKSSLLSAFLGEMYKISGRVNTWGSIAYVPQLAWIQNCSFQDNILFGKTLESKRYHKVINACALKQDLEMFPGGDRTEIGERGINVSGGQKQRISLARAVYADCDIYLLDDPLSAVDIHVGKHIFENVISSNGVLSQKTRLLVMNSINYLPKVDQIIVLKDGVISEVGTYNELLDKKGAFSEFLITHIQEVDNKKWEDFDSDMMEEIVNTNPEFHRQLSNQKSVYSSTSSVSSSLRRRRPSQLSLKSTIEKINGEKLTEEEKTEVGRTQWKIYCNYFRAVGLLFWSTSIIFTLVSEGLSLSSGILLSKWTDDKKLEINGTQDVAKRNMYLETYGLLGIGQTISYFISSVVWYVGAANAATLLHSLLLLNIMRSPMSFFETTPQGRILNRFAKEVDVLDNGIPTSLKQAFSFLAPVIGTVIIISYSTPPFMIVIIPLGFVYYWIQKCYIATSQQLKRMESVSRSPIYSHFGESISGSSVIRAYGAQDRFIKESEQKVDMNQASSYTSIVASRWLGIRLQLLGACILFFASLFAVIGKDYLSPGIVGLSISYTLEITMYMYMLVVMITEVETNIVSVERIKEYSDTPREAAWDITPSPVGTDWPKEGKLEFLDYKVRYREGLDLVLKGINLSIAGGEKIGIVGRTGAGKSSLTLSLFRIIESAGGKILIDSVDVTTLGLHTLRSHLTIIPQDPVLFSGSLRMNLDPFGYYSDEQVWRAIELAHLKHFVKGLTAGLQHEVTEGGENLSVGQRQLFCLARAVLRKTKILILDEATAAVDLETDNFIQRTIRTEFADCTVLTIAHRLNTVMDSNRVLVLDQGKVSEFESPKVLLKNRSSVFFSMAYEAGLV